MIAWLWALGTADAARLPAERVVYAVNCGSNAPLRSADGFVYAADGRYPSDTQVATWPQTSAPDGQTRYTDDPALYATERWASHSFTYLLPVRGDGHYVIVTQHAENAFGAPGQRVWDHYLGSRRVEAGVDAVREAGKGAGLHKYYEVELRGEQLLFQGEVCPEAYRGGEVWFTFGHTGRDNPMVNGIVVLRGRLEHTDFPRRAEVRAAYDRRYAQQRLESEFEEKFMSGVASGPLRRPRRNDAHDYIDEQSVLLEAGPARSRLPLALIALTLLLSLAVHLAMRFLAEARSAAVTEAAPAAEPPRPAARARPKKAKRA